MSILEDRLSAALAARAELVQPQDLRHDGPPAARPTTWRRPAGYLLAAAACLAAVAVPVVMATGGDQPSPTPQPTPTPTPTPNGSDVAGADWPVAYRYADAYDVDGDGTPDPLVIRTEGVEELPPGVRRVEAHLSSGGVAAVLLDYDTYDLTAIEPVDLDGDGSHEVLYFRGTSDGEEIGVLDLVEGALVDLAIPTEPGLTSEPDGQYRARGWFVADLGLFSYRTVDGGFVPGGSYPGEPPYEVEQVRWLLTDEGLVADPVGLRCWDGGNGAGSIDAC